MEFAETMTLAEARAALRELVDEGHACPCCTQFAKVYRRKINSTMARSLITLYRAGVGVFHHAPSLPGDTHEISQLVWWGLIEEEKVRRPDGGRAGWWQVTYKGVLFAQNALEVEKYAHVYDGRVLRRSGELTTIEEALGRRFDYRQLMAGV